MTGQRIWAPGRLDYIRQPGPEHCIFCLDPQGGPDYDRRRHVLHRGQRCFVILNAYPYTSGHLMVAPYEHVPSIEELDSPTLTELMELSQRALAALHAVYAPEGFNLGINQGGVAGAGVEDHVHQHVVPRWGGDTNFMTTVGSTRVLPQTLDDSWEELSRQFAGGDAR